MCTNACTRIRDRKGRPIDESRWCPECKIEHERCLDERGEVASLSIAHREIDDYLPATDAEWKARLDDMAPLVEDLAFIPASVTCPLCRGGKAITIDTPLVARNRIRVECPWCSGIGVVPDDPEWAIPDLSDRRAG